MAIEVRPATADEMPGLVRVVGRALAMSPDEFRALQPEMTLCVFDDGRVASVHGSWPLTMRFNGKAVPISGVTTVGTDPLDRGRGYLRQTIGQHFREMHEEGERPLAVLYASQAAIYQRFGYAIVSTHYSYQVEPRYLQFAEPVETPGTLREVDPEKDFGMLVDLYRAFREDRTGMVHRGKPMWDANVLAPVKGIDEKCAVVYEVGGRPQGYAVYTTGPGGYEGPEPGQKVTIQDIVWLAPGAYRAFWQNFARMPLARYILWPQAAEDDPLPYQVLEPRMLRRTAREGILARIVDLPATFRARCYPVEDRLTFAVDDPMCPWNSGSWQVITGKDDAEVTPLASGDPELRLTPNTLAMLLFGTITATEAERSGRLEVLDRSALPRWDAALRTMHAPFSSDNW